MEEKKSAADRMESLRASAKLMMGAGSMPAPRAAAPAGISPAEIPLARDEPTRGLLKAASEGNRQAAIFEIARGADLFAFDPDGQPCFGRAFAAGHVALGRELALAWEERALEREGAFAEEAREDVAKRGALGFSAE